MLFYISERSRFRYLSDNNYLMPLLANNGLYVKLNIFSIFLFFEVLECILWRSFTHIDSQLVVMLRVSSLDNFGGVELVGGILQVYWAPASQR